MFARTLGQVCQRARQPAPPLPGGCRSLSIMERAYKRHNLTPKTASGEELRRVFITKEEMEGTVDETSLDEATPKPPKKSKRQKQKAPRKEYTLEEQGQAVIARLTRLEASREGAIELPSKKEMAAMADPNPTGTSTPSNMPILQYVDATDRKKRLPERWEEKIDQPKGARIIKVAVLGEANAGKSTLINGVIGETISVVSARAHTTRDRVLGIWTEGLTQVIFLDTPGVPKGRKNFDRTLLTSPWHAVDEADFVMLVVDAPVALTRVLDAKDFMLKQLRKSETPAALILNKVDLIDDPDRMLPHMEDSYRSLYPAIQQTLRVSALERLNMLGVKTLLLEHAKEGNWMFPRGRKTDQAAMQRVEEQIRAELFERLYSYLPYQVRLETVAWSPQADGTLWVDVDIHLPRRSQKGVVIGSGGKVVTETRHAAQKALAKAFGRNVRLYLRVKAPTH